MSVEDEMTEKKLIFMNKYKTYIVYVCHINTTSSKHMSDLIVKKIPKALELFVFFLTVFNTVSNLIYMQF